MSLFVHASACNNADPVRNNWLDPFTARVARTFASCSTQEEFASTYDVELGAGCFPLPTTPNQLTGFGALVPVPSALLQRWRSSAALAKSVPAQGAAPAREMAPSQLFAFGTLSFHLRRRSTFLLLFQHELQLTLRLRTAVTPYALSVASSGFLRPSVRFRISRLPLCTSSGDFATIFRDIGVSVFDVSPGSGGYKDINIYGTLIDEETFAFASNHLNNTVVLGCFIYLQRCEHMRRPDLATLTQWQASTAAAYSSFTNSIPPPPPSAALYQEQLQAIRARPSRGCELRRNGQGGSKPGEGRRGEDRLFPSRPLRSRSLSTSAHPAILTIVFDVSKHVGLSHAAAPVSGRVSSPFSSSSHPRRSAHRLYRPSSRSNPSCSLRLPPFGDGDGDTRLDEGDEPTLRRTRLRSAHSGPLIDVASTLHEHLGSKSEEEAEYVDDGYDE